MLNLINMSSKIPEIIPNETPEPNRSVVIVTGRNFIYEEESEISYPAGPETSKQNVLRRLVFED